MCANPDALPHASNRPETPGFQVDLGRALAAGVGVPLEIDWIIPRIRAGLVDCDLLLDTMTAVPLPGLVVALARPGNSSRPSIGVLCASSDAGSN